MAKITPPLSGATKIKQVCLTLMPLYFQSTSSPRLRSKVTERHCKPREEAPNVKLHVGAEPPVWRNCQITEVPRMGSRVAQDTCFPMLLFPAWQEQVQNFLPKGKASGWWPPPSGAWTSILHHDSGDIPWVGADLSLCPGHPLGSNKGLDLVNVLGIQTWRLGLRIRDQLGLSLNLVRSLSNSAGGCSGPLAIGRGVSQVIGAIPVPSGQVHSQREKD